MASWIKPPRRPRPRWNSGRTGNTASPASAPRYRSGPESLKRCLFLTLLHLIENTDVENLFASCTPLLSRLYRRFGFNVLVKDASCDEQGTYHLIHGTVPDVLRALAGNEEERELAEDILVLREGVLA
jgi:hypothetical protein